MRETKWKWVLHLVILAVLFLLGLLWQPLPEILKGLRTILEDPSFLTRDYLALGGVGAAFWNAGLLLALELLIVALSRGALSGKLMASIFISVGGALFGINILGSLPIFFGAYLYAKLSGRRFGDLLFPTFMSAGLAPLVSTISFALGLPLAQGLVASCVAGIVAGFFMQILVPALASFHQGFTLYNAGFVTGIVGMMLVALMRTFGYPFQSESILSTEESLPLALLLIICSLSMLLLGIFLSEGQWKENGKILRSKGKMLEYEKEFGTGLMLMNMGLMGLIGTALIYIAAGRLNGAMVGATLGMIGFSAVGQQPFNSAPIVAGVILATLLRGGEMAPAMVVAMYGTCLAPITSEFGLLAGGAAGFLHTALVGTALMAHGGADLFNNGFSSGFVAAILVPFFYFLRERSQGRNNP